MFHWIFSAMLGLLAAAIIVLGLAFIAVWGSLLIDIMTTKLLVILCSIVWVVATLFVRYCVRFPIA